jgi:hypothetical protein
VSITGDFDREFQRDIPGSLNVQNWQELAQRALTKDFLLL